MSRPSQLISLEIRAARKHLQALGLELIEARLAERDMVVAMSSQGHPLRTIARAVGMSQGTVAGILFRAGKPHSGRHRVRVSRDVDLRALLDAQLSAALRERHTPLSLSAGPQPAGATATPKRQSPGALTHSPVSAPSHV